MAEEKKGSRAERMYGKGRRIQDADGGSQKEIAKPAAEARSTAGKPEKDVKSPSEDTIKPAGGGALDMAGGSVHDIPMDEVHAREMRDTHDRHRAELRDTHTRHEREMRSMMKRHEEERGGGEAGDKKPEKEVGKSGTEP